MGNNKDWSGCQLQAGSVSSHRTTLLKRGPRTAPMCNKDKGNRNILPSEKVHLFTAPGMTELKPERTPRIKPLLSLINTPEVHRSNSTCPRPWGSDPQCTALPTDLPLQFLCCSTLCCSGQCWASECAGTHLSPHALKDRHSCLAPLHSNCHGMSRGS